jgi:hypothetical protein
MKIKTYSALNASKISFFNRISVSFLTDNDTGYTNGSLKPLYSG